MKYLERIRVVQFFLYERQDIRLNEITGIFGPNGSGKSSMLDAVQIAMFGANSRLFALNAQADEQKTTRTLRAYCLGQYGENTDQRVRDVATTYITLIWRDTITNAPLSMGVCIYASADRDKHDVLGRYILPGVELTMGDHLETIDGEERPRDWKTFRHQLIERAKVSGETPLYEDATRYIQAMLLALRGTDSAPLQETFTRAFRFGLRMRFDKSVDEIVRNDVLEPRPTNIKKFREITESFRRLADLVSQVEEKINDGKKVESEFKRASDEVRKAVTLAVIEKMANAEVAQEKYEQASEYRDSTNRSLQIKQSQHGKLLEELAHAKQEVLRYRQAREAHSAHKNFGVINTEIERANETLRKKDNDLRSNLSLITRTFIDAAKSTFLSNEAEALKSASLTIKNLLEQLGNCTKNDIESTLLPVLKTAEKAFNELFKKGSAIEQEYASIQAAFNEAEASLQRIKEGRAPLSSEVQRLLTELRDHGLHPVPVCDLVNVKETAWQPVMEAYLGKNIEALLIAADEEKKAFGLYRGLKGPRAVYGAKLALESRHSSERPVTKGTVAELIEGTHPAAVSYLRRQFGDLRQAFTDEEALTGHRTLTQDGMLNSGGELERLRPVRSDMFRIGTGGPGHREVILRDQERAKAELAKLEKIKSEITNLRNAIMRVADKDSMLQYLTSTWMDMETAKQTITDKNKQLDGIADEEYVQLGQQEQKWSNVVKDHESRITPLNEDIGGLRNKLDQAISQEKMAQDNMDNANHAVKVAREHEEYDHELCSNQWDKLSEKYEMRFDEMATFCSAEQTKATERMNNAVSRGMRELGTFLETYREQAPLSMSEDWKKAKEWITELLLRLEKTELALYKEDMEAAYQTSQETFRNDVAIALNNNLEWLDETMGRLNSVLSTCPTFSNGERYHFRRKTRPQLESLLKFVKDVAAFGPAQDLFGGAGDMPEEFMQLLEDKIAPGSAGVRSPLDDYREFFEFDIEILREDPVEKSSKIVGHLSKRIGPGSGGEHRAPLYVIAGAALASAYRLDRGEKDGLRLMLLDEAFNKMDMTNIIATMRYLEELGLQVFMASPGENKGTLTAFLHRYYEILRDPDFNTIMIEGHDVSDEVRIKFREDLPEFNPELIEQEIAVLRKERLAQAPA